MFLATLICLLAVPRCFEASFGSMQCPSSSSNLLRTYEISPKCPIDLLRLDYRLHQFKADTSTECAIACNNAGKSEMFSCGFDDPSFQFKCRGFSHYCLAISSVTECRNGILQSNGICKCDPGFYGRLCEKYVKSCIDIYYEDNNNGMALNGTYRFETANGILINAKCEFRSDHVLTFISPSSLALMSTFDMHVHYNDATHIVLRNKYTNNTQKDSVLQQLSTYSNINLSFNLSETITNPPKNLNLGAFLYIRFVPMVVKGSTNGYRANDVDHSFINCDSNPQSSFTLYPNMDALQPAHSGRLYNHARQWETGSQSVDIAEYLEDDYFMLLEVAMGGCGALTVSSLWTDITGITAGFKYVIPAR